MENDRVNAGERPEAQANSGVSVLNPRERVPMSLIIDDSTCLVNLAHFCIPQFAEVFPDRYRQDWRRLPREIPDAFVREFGEWCRENGIRGKYSIVPNPACVGWMDRDLPGWTKRELTESLAVVRDFMTADWDIHPEMVTHTWVVDTKTGRPYPERTERFMENWEWTRGRSVDELANYMAYALRILQNVGLPCEGITTPGGFGNQVLPELAQATLEACRSVYGSEIPHYFRHVYEQGTASVAPRVEYAADLTGDNPRCVVSIIGCTGDWFGGWDGLTPGSADRFITADGDGGRLPEVIARNEPAILVCHWPGIYYNGERIGFRIFQEVVARLHRRYDNLLWMKLSAISRYWAARELTTIRRQNDTITLRAPFAAPDFTVRIAAPTEIRAVRFASGNTGIIDAAFLREVPAANDLTAGTWRRENEHIVACFDLPRGESGLHLQ